MTKEESPVIKKLRALGAIKIESEQVDSVVWYCYYIGNCMGWLCTVDGSKTSYNANILARNPGKNVTIEKLYSLITKQAIKECMLEPT